MVSKTKNNGFSTTEKLGAAFLMALGITGIVAMNNNVKGCIADADDKAYLVMKDGTVKRQVMPVHDTYCTMGNSSYVESYDLLDPNKIDHKGLPKTFVLAARKPVLS